VGGALIGLLGSLGVGGGPPGGARSFRALYAGDVGKAVAYVADLDSLLAPAQ
jgi:hypothetical protein